MSRLLIFGSGTSLPDAERGNSGYCWEAPAGLLLLDCGGSPYQRLLRAGLDPLRLGAIFLSHSHPDHIAGLPTLLFHLFLGGYKQELVVFGNQEVIERAQIYCTALDASSHSIQPRWQILPAAGGPVELACDLGASLTTAPTIHSRPTLALRLDAYASGRALVYGADADYSPGLVQLASGAHTLLHECTVSQPFANHSTPEQVGQVARQAGVERLVIIHYSPAYTAPEDQVVARVRQAGFEGQICIARDGEEYTL